MPDYEGPRSIEDHELPKVIDLLNLIFRPDGGDMGKEYPRHVALSNKENVRIIKEQGHILSHVATSVRPVSLAGISTWEAGIGAVATHPDGRGKGYASLLMQDAVERSVRQGADIMLISGDLGVYRRMHAVDCGCYAQVKIDKTVPKERSHFSFSPAQESDLDDILSLWETLPVRYILPREDWQALLQCKHVMDKPSDWWAVRAENDLVGLGIVHQQETELNLLDWAGTPEALDAAAAFWFQQYKVDSLDYIPSSKSLLPLAWKHHIQHSRSFEGTVLVINAQRFLQRAEAFLIQRVGEDTFSQLTIEAEEQAACFSYAGQRIELQNGGELAYLFFGHPDISILDEKLDTSSDLYRILQQMFPVPLVWYGVGYV